MGGNTSKQKIINEMLNQVSVEVMTRNSSSASASSDQENKLVISNVKGSTISGITQISTSKINVTALQKSVSEGKLQSDLVASLTNKVMQEAPQLGIATKSEQEVRNIVKNNIDAKINNENLQNIAANVKQRNSAVITNVEDNALVTGILQKNEAEAILTLTNDANNKIATELTTDAEVKNDVTQKSADLFGGFGAILIVIAVVIGGGFLFMQGTMNKVLQPKNLMLIGGAVVVILLLMMVMS
jgi:hypothetical protein